MTVLRCDYNESVTVGLSRERYSRIITTVLQWDYNDSVTVGRRWAQSQTFFLHVLQIFLLETILLRDNLCTL
jgi:hypothetical protein